jgi:hypothetical protein
MKSNCCPIKAPAIANNDTPTVMAIRFTKTILKSADFKKWFRNKAVKASHEIANTIITSINVFKINNFLGGKGKEKWIGT